MIKNRGRINESGGDGHDSEGVVKGFPDNITSEQLNHVMSFATDAQLETVFSNANNANKMVELLGDDSTSSSKTAILKRLQSRPQLAALLMKQVPDQSSTAATTAEAQMEELADAGATTGAQKLNFFKQLGSVAQQHVMSNCKTIKLPLLLGMPFKRLVLVIINC